MKSITNSNNINVRKNYGSNDSHTYAAPKKYGVANKFDRSKEKTVHGLRKNSSKATCTYQALKSTINNFSNLAKYSNHMKKPSGSENVSLHHEGHASIRNFPLRDITKQLYKHELNEELRNEYIFDVASTESDQ